MFLFRASGFKMQSKILILVLYSTECKLTQKKKITEHDKF
jgi:hypothetical protein